MLMTNAAIHAAIQSMAHMVEQDQHGGVLRMIHKSLVEHGILGSMPEATLDPYRALPHDWTAIQFAMFDNGEPEMTRKRSKIQRTKMRYAVNIKVWTRDKVRWKDGTQVAWQSNAYLWTGEQALAIGDDLLEEKLIDAATVGMLRDNVDGDDGTSLFSIPLFTNGKTGTRWMKRHALRVVTDDKGVPNAIALVHPDLEGELTVVVTREPSSESTNNGLDLRGNVIGQFRVARHENLHSDWSTENFESSELACQS